MRGSKCGGTYRETDSTGTVTSSGTYQIADMADEGLGYLGYMDTTGNRVSSCTSAVERYVVVHATLIDSAGASRAIAIAADIYPSFPLATVGNRDGAFEEVPSSSAMTITC